MLLDLVEKKVREQLLIKYPEVKCPKCFGKGYYYESGSLLSSGKGIQCDCPNSTRYKNVNEEQNIRMEALLDVLVDLAMSADISGSKPLVTKILPKKETGFRSVLLRPLDLETDG